MRARDLADQVMRPQQCELAADRGSPALLFGLRHRRVGVQQSPQVAVAKAVDGELAPADRLDRSGVGRCMRVERADPPAVSLRRAAQPGGQFAERGDVVD